MLSRWWWAGVLALLWVGGAQPAAAFVYLEHAWFTDRGCHAALDRLAQDPRLGTDDALTARYLALAVLCPTQPMQAYCKGDQKQPTSLLHVLGEAPDDANTPPVTMGDLSALVDHISRFGPVRNLPRAARDGLLARVAEWLFIDDGAVGGVVSDVAEEQCEAADGVAWAAVEGDVVAALRSPPGPLPAALLAPLARLDAPLGPTDPDGLFTFDNPHYLDLVERNHAHFGAAAHGHWAGYHAAAGAIAERACEVAVALDDDDLDERADEAEQRGGTGCAVVGDRLVARLAQWQAQAPGRWTRPVAEAIGALQLERRPGLRAALPSALFGAVFEAAGQHYLQDTFAGGHIRVDRGALGLQESRYDHNRDGAHGVLAWLATGARGHAFVAYGDGRLLGPRAAAGPHACVPGAPPEVVTDCLVRHQRGLVALASTASFVDWALGVPLQRRPAAACAARPALEAFACAHLPTAPMRADGTATPPPAAPQWIPGSLPNPPPSFDFEDLGTAVGIDPAGGENRLALRLKLFTPIDRWGDWARSHQVEVAARRRRWELGYGHLFHLRLAARVLLDGGLFQSAF